MHLSLFSFFTLNFLSGVGFLYFLLLSISFYSLQLPDAALQVLGASLICLSFFLLRMIQGRRHEISLTQKAAKGFLIFGFIFNLAFWFAGERCFTSLTLGSGGPLRYVFALGLFLSSIPLFLLLMDYPRLPSREIILKSGWFGPYNPKAAKIRQSRKEERWHRQGR